MLESDGSVYGCVPMVDSESGQICEAKYGAGFKAYHPTNSCDEKLAADLRGTEYDSTKGEEIITEASCLQYEVGTKLGCQFWDYNPAYNYCASNYGEKYLPFTISKTCSIERADYEFGYIDANELISGLDEKITEAESILTLIDREGMHDSLQGLISRTPIIGNEFYSDVMKGLLSKIKIINAEIEKRSQYKVKLQGEAVEQFVKDIYRYFAIVSRVYKIYAIVAHKNHKKLDTYSFDNLSFLSLKLKKVFALEVLANLNMKVRTLENDMVEIYESDQNKELYEYMALSNPKNEVDYAKLISFFGIRENLVNVWALDRMSDKNLLAQNISSCGEFLSFKPQNSISSIASVKENSEYDLFYNEYLEKEEKLKEKISEYKLVEAQDVKNILLKIYAKNAGLSSLIQEYYQNNANDAQVNKHFSEDGFNISKAIEEDLNAFVKSHFRTFVMPGDRVTNINNLKSRIISETKKRQIESFKSFVLGQYPWISVSEMAQIEKEIEKEVLNYARSYEKKLASGLDIIFQDYGMKKISVENNYKKKVDHTLTLSKEYAKYANMAVLLERNETQEVKYAPSTIKELMTFFEHKMNKSFQDVRLTLEKDEKLAKVLSEFFTKVTEKFNSEYFVQTGLNEFQHKGEDEERSAALWQFMFEVAKEYYENNSFELSELALVPNATMLARDRDSMARNPYTIKVFRDGTPVTLHINDFYETLESKMYIDIPWRDIAMKVGPLFGLDEIDNYGNRNIADKTTDGTFDRPKSYISSKGEIKYDHLSDSISYSSLKRLYMMSMDYTKDEIKDNLVLQREHARNLEEYNKEKNEDIEIIKDGATLFARIFELFKLPMGAIANNYSAGEFRLDKEDKKILLTNKLSEVYGQSALLKNRITTKEMVRTLIVPRRDTQTPYFMDLEENIERTLLLKIGLEAYENNEFNTERATQLIKKVIAKAELEIVGKVQEFCSANPYDFKKDKTFRDTFASSVFLRETVKSDQTITPKMSKHLKELDENVRKLTRTKMSALNEDFLEPGMLYFGAVAILAIGIIASAATMGTAAPGALATLTAYSTWLLAASNWVFLPMIAASTYTRINTQFIEVPAQLKFQKSLAYSQIDQAKVADFELVDQIRNENRVASYWTVGFLPLDLLFGYQIAGSVKSWLGYTGAKSFKNLTGMELRKFSSPPQASRVGTKFSEYRMKYGVLRSAYKKVGNSINRLTQNLPRNQMLPEHFIKSAPLRMGIANTFKKLKIHNRPWVIGDEVSKYYGLYENRLKTYNKYLIEEAKVIEYTRLEKGLKLKEVFSNGFWSYSKFGFTMSSFYKALKEKRLLSYLREYGDLMEGLHTAQLKVVQDRMIKIKTIKDKIEKFKFMREGDEVIVRGGTELTDDLIKELSDEEIMLLLDIGKKTNGYLAELKPIFKEHTKLIRSLHSVRYQYGHTGELMNGSEQSYNDFLRDSIDSKYIFKSDKEDLVNFYEGVIRQSYRKDNAQLDDLMKSLEEHIETLFIVDRFGHRIY